MDVMVIAFIPNILVAILVALRNNSRIKNERIIPNVNFSEAENTRKSLNKGTKWMKELRIINHIDSLIIAMVVISLK